MCESNAYLAEKNGQEKLLMEDVVLLEPQKDGTLLLVNLLGERKQLRARIDNIDFMKHKLLLRETK